MWISKATLDEITRSRDALADELKKLLQEQKSYRDEVRQDRAQATELLRDTVIDGMRAVTQACLSQNEALLDRLMSTCNQLVDFELSKKSVGQDYGTMLAGGPDKEAKEQAAQRDALLKELDEMEQERIAARVKGEEFDGKRGVLQPDI